jgi:hypothetical protein
MNCLLWWQPSNLPLIIITDLIFEIICIGLSWK